MGKIRIHTIVALAILLACAGCKHSDPPSRVFESSSGSWTVERNVKGEHELKWILDSNNPHAQVYVHFDADGVCTNDKNANKNNDFLATKDSPATCLMVKGKPTAPLAFCFVNTPGTTCQNGSPSSFHKDSGPQSCDGCNYYYDNGQ